MATVTRRPLAQRGLATSVSCGKSPSKQTIQRVASGSKRARSPEPKLDCNSQSSVKRSKVSTHNGYLLDVDQQRLERDRKRKERDQAKEVFRTKYTNAFPKFRFYFDLDLHDPTARINLTILQSAVKDLGATCDNFFSNQITHLITDKAITLNENETMDKENSSKLRLIPSTRSPQKRRAMDEQPTFDIVQKALAFERKVWSSEKLRNILDRLVPTSQSPSHRYMPQNVSVQRPLTRLLEVERLHGTTERDPSQRRHDFRYFSRGSFFVLVEDMRQELATIHALEYPITKGKDGATCGAWPVLYCHPHSRGPFIEFDDKERRVYEKAAKLNNDREQREKDELREREEASMRRKAQAQQANRKTDLRRCASMNNLKRRESNGEPVSLISLEAESVDSANASGYLVSNSGYVAASGNSVGITSTNGTTSTVGLYKNSLPSGLRAQERQQVITSRKVVNADFSGKYRMMGPPAVPCPLLRKTKSTNSIRLPKRQEGAKPGYCESCRVKFEDFKTHTASRSHRKFAMNEANFLLLDVVLGQVKRRSLEEVAKERSEWESRCREVHSIDTERDLATFMQTDEDKEECEAADLMVD